MSDPVTRLNAALSGRYTIERELGEGGMATVYLAKDLKHERKVALKVLKPELAAVVGAERFLAEIKTTANLQHPHILPLFDSGEADGFLFYAMPYVEGETLRDRIDREKQLPVDEAVKIATDVAEALDYAHRHKVIHRDIKPGNILLQDGEPVVADFGIALAVGAAGSNRLTETGLSLGTPHYMSPEQATGDQVVGPPTDIYALGCVLYEMLVGEPPYTGSTAQAILGKIIAGTPDPVATERPSVPANVDAALARSLEKLPADRFASAQDFVEALSDSGFRHGEIGTAAAATPWNRVAVTGWATAAGMATLAAVFAVAFTRSSGVGARSDVVAAVPDYRPITATGDAWNVSISPDGETVTYLTSEGLVTQDLSGGDPILIYEDTLWSRALTRFGEPKGEPRWLPDGSGVAFTAAADSTTLGVYAVPRTGGDAQLRQLAVFEQGEIEASLHPMSEGAFLLARVLENERARPWLRIASREGEEVVPVPDEIVDLWDAVASPDGRWIAFLGERADRTTILATLPRDGGQLRVIVEGGADLSKWAEKSVNSQWASHGIIRWREGRLYYRRLSDRGMDLYAVGVDLSSGERTGGDPQLVLSGLPFGGSFDVSADGKRIVYSGGVIRTQIKLYDLTSGTGDSPVDERTLTRGTARHVAPRISPDGQRVAYIRRVQGSDDIYIVPLSGEAPAERVHMLLDWNRLRNLRWSPSGDRLMVLAETPDRPQLVMVSIADGRVEALDTPVPRADAFLWSQDGRRLVYQVGNDNSWLLRDLQTGEDRELFTDLEGELIFPWFSPHGSELLTWNIEAGPGQGLWAQSLDGSELRLVSQGWPTRRFIIHGSDDGTLYILDLGGTVYTLPISGGTPRPVAQLPDACIWEGEASMTPDLQYLACSVDEARESDVWVVDLVEGS